MTWQQIWWERLKGVWIAVVLLLLGLGLFSQLIPNSSQGLGTLARMTDNLRPHLLAMSGAMALALVWDGGWRLGGALCLVALVGLATLSLDYRSRIAPSGSDTDLTVLWFNLLYTNPISPDRLEAAIRTSGAELVALAEAEPAQPVAARLADLYPYRLGCSEEGPCDLLVLSKFPIEQASLVSVQAGDERLARFRLRTPDGHEVGIVAAHVIKPWYLPLARREWGILHQTVRQDRDRPLIVMGDLNAAPWSYWVKRIERWNGLRHAFVPIATWPKTVGQAGIPIDHILLGRQVALTGIASWGADLGSNHLGLLARIDLPEPAE